MKALIVGCGYVGTALGAELARQGHQVHGLRRGQTGEEALKARDILPVLADITRRASLDALPRDFEWVVNCVSASGGGAEEYRRVYVEGNRNLVDWLQGSGVSKFVYTSSTGVYGQNDGSPVDETSPTSPEAETGKALVEAEQVLLQAARNSFPALILRLAGIYGPGRGYWLRQFLSGETRMEGDGGRILNMIHRDDVVGATIAALQRGRAGEVYNVVDDEPVSQRVLFEWMASRHGRALPPATPASLAGKKRGATNKSVSNRRLRAELRYVLRYPTFREGFEGQLRVEG